MSKVKGALFSSLEASVKVRFSFPFERTLQANLRISTGPRRARPSLGVGVSRSRLRWRLRACKREVAIGLVAAGSLVAVNEGLSVALGSRRPRWWSMCVWVLKGGLLYLAPSLGGAQDSL